MTQATAIFDEAEPLQLYTDSKTNTNLYTGPNITLLTLWISCNFFVSLESKAMPSINI